MVKSCSNCKIRPRRERGNNYCAPCHAEYVRGWYQRNKDKVRDTQFKQKYGISLSDYEEMLASQNGVCAICEKEEITERFKYLSVDHDHEFGYVRGLLCGKCNRGIGNFLDSKELLQRAIDYLDKWEV